MPLDRKINLYFTIMISTTIRLVSSSLTLKHQALVQFS